MTDEERKARRRESQRKYRENNREKVLESQRKYRANNPTKDKEYYENFIFFNEKQRNFHEIYYIK